VSTSQDYDVLAVGGVVDEKAGWSTQCRIGNVRTCAELGMRCSNPAHPKVEAPKIGDSRPASRPEGDDPLAFVRKAAVESRQRTEISHGAEAKPSSPLADGAKAPTPPKRAPKPRASTTTRSTSPKPKEQPMPPVTDALTAAKAAIKAELDQCEQRVHSLNAAWQALEALNGTQTAGNGDTPPQVEKPAAAARPKVKLTPKATARGGKSKFTDDQQRVAATRVANGESIGQVAKDLGVAWGTIQFWVKTFPDLAS
jgi:hypothetical protein